MKVYIAGPFFNKKQVELVEHVKEVLEMIGIDYYSPKDESLYTPGGSITPSECFSSNIAEIEKCRCVVAITDDMDAGTLFECGVAYEKDIPICYIWINHYGRKFNLMLSESASAVCYSCFELLGVLSIFQDTGEWPFTSVKGEVE